MLFIATNSEQPTRQKDKKFFNEGYCFHMLTKQHAYATRLGSSKLQKNYRAHMCGVCNSLGNEFGDFYRLFTAHQLTLLNILISAQQSQEVRIIQGRCPINLLQKVEIIDGASSTVAASAAILLGRASIEDHIKDSQSGHLLDRALNLTLESPAKKALKHLDEIGLDLRLMQTLTDRQATLERSNQDNSDQPTAQLAGELFSLTARLTSSGNEEVLSRMGNQYGSFIYWMDAYQDYADDIREGGYNPFRSSSEIRTDKIILKEEGIETFTQKIDEIATNLRQDFSQLHLKRFHQEIFELFVEPVQHISDGLVRQKARVKQLAFHRWSFTDILKAVAFITPKEEVKFSPINAIPLVFSASTESPDCETITSGGNDVCQGCGELNMSCARCGEAASCH